MHEGTGGSGGAAPPRRPEALARGVRGAGRPPVKTTNHDFSKESESGIVSAEMAAENQYESYYLEVCRTQPGRNCKIMG